MHEILPGLWLGNFMDARDSSDRVDVVVNCTTNLPFFVSDEKPHVRIPLEDNESENATLAPYLATALVYLRTHLLGGKSVLVHCFAGIQRSAALVAAYVMCDKQISADEAVEFVRARREEAFMGGVNFMPSLRFAERMPMCGAK